MKKIYITPRTISFSVASEGLIATSGGLDNGDNVGNLTPDGDDDDNFFTNRGNSLWDNWSE